MLNLTIDSDNIEYSFNQIATQLLNAYLVEFTVLNFYYNKEEGNRQ